MILLTMCVKRETTQLQQATAEIYLRRAVQVEPMKTSSQLYARRSASMTFYLFIYLFI